MKNKNINLLTIIFVAISFFLTPIFVFNNSYAEHSINFSTSDIQEIEVSVLGSGTAISEAEINVTTTCPAGYNLSLSTTIDDNNLYLNGNKESSAIISPSDGITSLVSSSDTWGFYLPSLNSEAPTADNIFTAVPTLENPITLRTPAQTASETSIDDTFSIYYGVKVSNNTIAGQYKMAEDENGDFGAIVYYATLPETCYSYVIEYNPTGTNTGVTVTGTGSIASQSIAEGISANLTTEVYGNPVVDGTTYYFIGWNTAKDGSGTSYSSGQSVTDLALAGETITLYAQWTDCPSEHVCYYKNNTNAEGTMGYQSATNNSSITLLAPNYSLANHGFIGWSKDKDASTKFANQETVGIYGPNETISTDDLSLIGLQLYAVWLEAEENLQEWNNCSNLAIGDVVALQDSRDNNAYAVAKLADGRCWMIENLRLESDGSTGNKALLSQGYNSSFTGLAESEDDNFSDSTVSNSLYSTNGTTDNTVSGDYIGSRFPRYNNLNTTSRSDKPANTESNIYNYGNYYTWTAAIADTTASFSINTVVDTTSICPSGWRLPRGGNKDIETNNDYWTLIVEGINNGVKPSNYDSFARPYYYGDTEGATISELLKQFPNNFLQSGYYSSSSASSRGTIGGYWSSVASVNNGAYLLNLESNRVDPGTSFSPKYYGYSIRCLFDDDE